jgi:hypothetical protein
MFDAFARSQFIFHLHKKLQLHFFIKTVLLVLVSHPSITVLNSQFCSLIKPSDRIDTISVYCNDNLAKNDDI